MNYFATRETAERYARFRPDFHAYVAREIGKQTGPLSRALDVGCGTGQSSRALTDVADAVVGVDAAREMLAQAAPHPAVRYVAAVAESLPFPDARFDLVSVGLAFHWFDQPAFLREARRVLAPSGYLAIYDDIFMGMMAGEPEYQRWHEHEYLKRFPNPPRNLHKPHAGDWASFSSLTETSMEHECSFKLDDWIGYLTTQTNVIAAVQAGSSLPDIHSWLHRAVKRFFGTRTRNMVFRCTLSLYAAMPQARLPRS